MLMNRPKRPLSSNFTTPVILAKSVSSFADADIDAGFELRAALADENRSATDQLAAEPLHTQSLRVAIPAVSRAADAFFMSHE
jgi:hypothetical protein